MDTTPVSLLDQLKKPQQQAAWQRFAELYTPLLYYWARSRGLAEADAADLVQEVFLVLVKQLPGFQYDRDGSFRAWLRTVTFNKLRELNRRIRPQTVDNLDEHADGNSDPWDEKEYRLHVVHEMLRVLQPQVPPSTWRLFERYAIAGEDAHAIARTQGVKLGTVYAAKSFVLRRLRTELKGILE